MSHRERRTRGSARSGWGSRAAVGILVVAVVGAGVVHAMIGRYLRSGAFRQLLSSEVSKAANVDGSFEPFRWEGLAVDTDRFNATGSGVVRKLSAEGIHNAVLNAAGMRMFDVVPETGERVLKFTRNMIAESGRLHPPRGRAHPQPKRPPRKDFPPPSGSPPDIQHALSRFPPLRHTPRYQSKHRQISLKIKILPRHCPLHLPDGHLSAGDYEICCSVQKSNEQIG